MMSTGEDEPSPSLNGRLRPRKSTTATSSPQNNTIRKTEGKLAQDKPKRTSTPSKASPSKQNDLATKSDTSSAPLFLCPYCDRKFYAKQTASKHARRIHHSASKQDNFIKCIYCSHSDAESNAIIKHMVDSHPNQYFACLECHTRFPSTTELAEHKLNVCEKQKPSYRSKLRQKISTGTKKNTKKANIDEKSDSLSENTQYTEDRGFNGIVISCELKPSDMHDAFDIEDKITTNLILPHSNTLGNAGREKSAVIVLDDLQWNKRIPSNFSFHNSDADQILSRLGVVHRSPRVGESRKDLIRLMDEPNEKFEKCFDTSFYSKVSKNVQDNLTKYLDGSFNFNPNKDNKDNTIKTRKSKTSMVINTAEGFPILLSQEQFSRNLIDGFIPRAMAPKHKWKWDTAENDRNMVMLLDQTKRDSHVSNCIITLISSLDIWTQLRMKSKFEGIFKTAPTAKKTEKQNIISMELKEILESRDIPTTSSQVVRCLGKPVETREGSELPAYLGLSPRTTRCELMPAVLSGEWVRPRCYVCCACGEQTNDARALSAHLTSQHPNAQVQHYEIVGETLLSADILKHLYVPPSQISNRTRPLRGFRDCTKCKKSITLEDLHQHMLDCAGDTPTVRRKCRYRPFGVRRRRPRLPDNTIRKKMRKAISSRHRQKPHMRPRPRIRTEVGDAETIRKMIADLPAKRNRISPSNVLRPRRNILKAKKPVKLRAPEDKKSNKSSTLKKPKKAEDIKKQNDTDNSSTVDEDDQPLKLSSTRVSTRSANNKKTAQCRAIKNKPMKKKQSNRKDSNMRGFQSDYNNYEMHHQINPSLVNPMFDNHMLPHNLLSPEMIQSNVFRPDELRTTMFPPFRPYYFPNQLDLDHAQYNHLSTEQMHQQRLEQAHHNHQMALRHAHGNQIMEQMHHVLDNVENSQAQLCLLAQEQHNQLSQVPHNQLAQVPHNQLVIDRSHQKIDMHGAGPSNIRQRGNHDDKNIGGGKNIPVGGENDSNQNNNIGRTPNVPLKHSIASLTSNNEFRDTAAPYHQPYLLSSNIDKTRMPESFDIRQDFEKEGTAEKLDKPPLPSNAVEPKKPDTQLYPGNSSYKDDDSGGHFPSLVGTAGSRKSDLKLFLPNDTLKFRESDEQAHSPNNLIVSAEIGEQPPILVNIKESEEPNEQLPFPIDSINSKEPSKLLLLPNPTKSESNPKESSALTEEQIKTETDKLKLNKTRKGLNDCIAMLRTKKGLRLDPATGEYGYDESLDSEMIDAETPINVVSNSALTLCKTKDDNAENSVNLTPAQVFSRSVLSEQYQGGSYSETRTQCVSSHNSKSSLQTDKTNIQQRKTCIDSEPTSKQKMKREVTRARSLSHTDMEKSNKDMQKERTFFVKPSPRQPSNVYSENVKMRRNSVDGTQILDDPFYQHRFAETAKTLMAMNIPNLTQTMLKDKEELLDGLQHSRRIVNEMHKQQNFATAIENAAVQGTDKEKIDNMIVQQVTVSPTSRRTRRKPVKKIPNPEQRSPFIYERSMSHNRRADNFTVMSPTHHGSYNFASSPKEPNSNLVCGSNLQAGSSPIETLPAKTPPSPQIRKESHKRVLSSSETNAGIVHNYCDNGSQNKMLKKSPGTHPEHYINLPNVRRHSIESAIAQNTPVKNYDILMLQAYRERERCEKAVLENSPSSRGPLSQSSKITQDDFIKRPIDDNTRRDRPNELRSRYPSTSTFVLTTHDTHGVMHVNRESVRSDIANMIARTVELEDTHQMRFENEHFIRKQHIKNANNFGTKMADTQDGGFSEKKGQESKTTVQNSNILVNNLHRLGIRRSSGNYYTRSSPYQSNIQNVNINISDHSIDIVPDENIDTLDIALCEYQESVASFVVPKTQYLNNIYGGTSLQSCELNAEDITPLDLSCDPKIRLEKVLDTCNKTSEVSKNCDIPIANKKACDEPFMTVNFGRNYDQQLRNHPQHPTSSCGKHEDEPANKELVHEATPDILEETDKNKANQDISMINRNNIMSNQRNKRDTALSVDTTQSENLQSSGNLLYDSSQKHLYNEGTSTSSSDQLFPTALAHNYFTPPQLQTSNSVTYYRQESMQEKTFLENKKITRSFQTQKSQVMEAKFQDETSFKCDTDLSTSAPTVDMLTPNVENVKQYESLSNMGHRMSSLNTPTEKANEKSSQNNQMLEAESGEKTAQIRNHDLADHASVEQDAETARKFAMLPEELVKILDTIPKDHRTQLLNVLPQYVSTSVAAAEKNMTNTFTSTVVNKNSVNPQIDNNKHTAVCGDSNRLSVNTIISPSSIIPKKRHSPSQSRGSLNSNEAQTSFAVLRPSLTSTLPQSSQLECDEMPTNNAANFLHSEVSHEIKDSEHSEPGHFTGLVTRKLLEPDYDNTEMNVADFSETKNINRNKEYSTSAGVAYIPPIITQDLTNKPPSKGKHCNEQTASLRAVRIKTTIARKSFSDEKNLFMNYSYNKTSISGDEEYANSGQITNSQHHSYKHLTGFQFEKVNNNPQTNNYNSEVLLRASTGQNPNDNLQGDKGMGPFMTPNIIEEKNEDFTASPCSAISQNENRISHSRQINDQFCKTIKLELSASAALQGTNKVVDHFLGQMNSATFSDGGSPKELMSVQTFPFCNESKEQLINSALSHDNDKCRKDFTTELNSKPPCEVTENINTIETVEETEFYRSPEITSEKQTLALDSSENNNARLNFNKVYQEKIYENKPITCSERLIDNTYSLPKTTSLNAVISNEEDSDDDVSLAIIKQKHCTLPIITEVERNTSENPAKQSKCSTKLSREKRNRSKVVAKRWKKKISRKSEAVQYNKLTISGNDTNDVIEASDIELSYKSKDVTCNQNKKVPNTLPSNTIVIVDKINNDMNEFDINKENNITENVNKRKEDGENNLLPECNQLEFQGDNCIDKSTENKRESTPISVSLDMNLQPGDKNMAVVQEIHDVSDVISSCNFEITKICESVESQSKTKREVETPDLSKNTETECWDTSTVGGRNVSNNPVKNRTNLLTENEDKSEVSKEDSTKISSLATSDAVDVITDLQLCSEICEINALSLRRSRRGKSLYADSNYLEDIEHIVQVDEVNKKAPLTMKRLILSRVEKDKRVSECSTSEKNNDSINDLNDSEETDLPCIKGKLVKRKKSPSSRRKSKKIKATSVHQHDTESSDHSNLNNASENQNCILRELPNPENKIEDLEISKEEVKCRATSDNTTSLSENSTLVDNEIECEVPSVSLIESKESSVPAKRKLNITNITDLVVPQSKKSKYKKKCQSDFDSDDEKVLLETKKGIAAEKNLTEALEKEDIGSVHSKDCVASNEGLLPIVNASMAVETRVTCYNRQSSNRRPRSSSASFKDHADYDPYDIDFEDMVESSVPVIKKKIKNVGNVNSAKSHHNTKLDTKSENLSSLSTKILNKSKTKQSNVTNESDSDSSKSDVPLQKYVDEKALESELKKTNKDSINEVEVVGKEEVKTLIQKKNITQQPVNSKGKKSTKRPAKDDSSCEHETNIIDHSVNTNNNVQENSQKQQNKEKKSRRTLAVQNVESINVSTDVDQQLLSDKFMENFGFYSERIPRKSNLLASKKISETFHNMISNDIDDSDFCYKERSSKKSTQIENKKKVETVGDNTISQDSKILTSDETNSIIQSTESKANNGETLNANGSIDEIKNDDSDLDSLTARSIMESEEIRILENDLFSGLKEAAEASAAKDFYKESQHTNNLDTITQDVNSSISVMQTGERCDKIEGNAESIKKRNKHCKPNKQVGVKDKINPDIDDIDLDTITQDINSSVSIMQTGERCDKIEGNVDSIKKRNKHCKPNKQVGVKDKMYPDIDEINLDTITQDINSSVSVMQTGERCDKIESNVESIKKRNKHCKPNKQVGVKDKINPDIDDIDLDTITQDINSSVSIMQTGERCDKIEGNADSIKKRNKHCKPNKQVGVKDKMYPDIDEINLDTITQDINSSVSVMQTGERCDKIEGNAESIKKRNKHCKPNKQVGVKDKMYSDIDEIDLDTVTQDINSSVSVMQTGERCDKIEGNVESIKKRNKNCKPNKQVGVKDKMYPDIDEIDMFEDKFDKIKRKRRSQAVAAKQVQNNFGTNTSVKSRKQTEKKRTTKSLKKNNQSTQVLTKGALKGFEGIKISIPTQDLNMPSNVSPPRQQKRRKKVTVKRRKASESESSCSEFDKKEKNTLVKDIYEFKDCEDTELFELRPSTVMDRFRSMHNKNKFKHKERDKPKGDMEKEKQKVRGRERKTEVKDKEMVNVERENMKEREKYSNDEHQKRQNKFISEEALSVEKDIQRDLSHGTEQLNFKEKSRKFNENLNFKSTPGAAMDDNSCTKIQKFSHPEITRNRDEYHNNKNEIDSAVASTSGFVPDRLDESDYESELSSPEGEFIFYTSDDVNCVCPSDNDSDESDIEKGCGRLNCMYKNRNADKNAAIGNIFKNNAVRCEKTETKEPEKPKPNLDQLFDSLFDTRPSSETSGHQKVSEQAGQSLTRRPSITSERNVRVSASLASHHDLIKSKQEHTVIAHKEIISICDESFRTTSRHDSKSANDISESKKIVTDKYDGSKNQFTSNNEIVSDSDSLHIFTNDDKVKDNFGYSLVSEECTQVNFADIIADEIVAKNEANEKSKTKLGAPDRLPKYDSEDEFDIDKPESLTRQYMHLVLPADKASSCAQTEHKSDNSDAESGNESAATKYLKGLSPSEAAKLEIYTMVCAQSTQTVKPEESEPCKRDDLSRSKSEDEVQKPIVARSRIRLQKFDIREIAHKSKSSKSIQTDKNKSCKSSQHDDQVESDNDNVLSKLIDHALKEPDSDSTSLLNEEVSTPEYADSFATPALRPAAEKHSPRKSDEGISTSHDYSADAFDQVSLDDTGVARQRARRKCTVGKQNVLAEHWSSESEFDGGPPRPNSADSVVASVSRKKKSKKKDGHHSGGRRGNRHTSKNESKGGSRRAASGGRSDDSDTCAGPSRAPPGPKIRARPAHHYWSSDAEDGADPQPQHGWIVGDSHKKLVTMLAHAKGRKRNNGDKLHSLD